MQRELESRRVTLEKEILGARDQRSRNKLGQFPTPYPLAKALIDSSLELLPERNSIRFLDPAFGTGSFYSALIAATSPRGSQTSVGFEIDPKLAFAALEIWQGTGLQLDVSDFLNAEAPAIPSQRFDLIVCNPPYVRHHHLDPELKTRMSRKAEAQTGIKLGGLSGLYCYFLLLCDAWLAPDGLGVWLLPSEFMDVNYGKSVRHYLTTKVDLLRLHRFDPDDVQFDDALVSSAVLWFRKRAPSNSKPVRFTYGGSVASPTKTVDVLRSRLRQIGKWTSLLDKHPAPPVNPPGPRLGDLFTVKRGIATGSNSFFILGEEEAARRQLPKQFLKPILPSPRNLQVDEVPCDPAGNPAIPNRLVLVSCNLPEVEVERRFPTLWRYLQEGKTQGVAGGYLCQHRSPWYVQEERLPPPFLCTYMGRGSGDRDAPFRFILNHSAATATNVYLLIYPKPQLARILAGNQEARRAVWDALNEITGETLIRAGRVYGGGLYKMEPRELEGAPARKVLDVLPKQFRMGIISEWATAAPST